MGFLTNNELTTLIDRATNEELVEPDIEILLQLVDHIRQEDIPSKTVITRLSTRLQNKDPHITVLSLKVSDEARVLVLSYIQSWAHFFKGKPQFNAIIEEYESLKNKGYVFPEFLESDAMFSVESAPEWQETNACYRCQAKFTTFKRRHHCRNCGFSVCNDCSLKTVYLPKYGIEKEVRVCDHCFDSITGAAKSRDIDVSKIKAQKEEQARKENKQRDRELAEQEAEELQLALALSASEAACNQQPSQQLRSASIPSQLVPTTTKSLQPITVLDTSGMDPELARYLSRSSYPQQQAQQSGRSSIASIRPTAPLYASPTPSHDVTSIPFSPTNQQASTSTVSAIDTIPYPQINPSIDLQPSAMQSLTQPPQPPTTADQGQNHELDEFMAQLKVSVNFFVNRMQSDQQRGRSIVNDTTVQTLFKKLHQLYPELLRHQEGVEKQRVVHEELQDKLTQITEAREALDALRHEHETRRKAEEEEAARLRQMVMMQKLEALRQQKHEALELERRMALEATLHQQNRYQQQYAQQQSMYAYGQPSTGTYPYQYNTGQQYHPTNYDPNAGSAATVNTTASTYYPSPGGSTYIPQQQPMGPYPPQPGVPVTNYTGHPHQVAYIPPVAPLGYNQAPYQYYQQPFMAGGQQPVQQQPAANNPFAMQNLDTALTQPIPPPRLDQTNHQAEFANPTNFNASNVNGGSQQMLSSNPPSMLQQPDNVTPVPFANQNNPMPPPATTTQMEETQLISFD